LRLTTILWVNPDSGDASKAMFKDPKDRNYILREGDKIGKNNGVILRIGKGEVTVVEKYKDPFGNESIKETPVLPMSSRATQ
jgi:Tfp pilus assembly protein PilP